MSQVGTRRGDPLAMSSGRHEQKRYGDDAKAVRKLEFLIMLYRKLQEHGPAFGSNILKLDLETKETKKLQRFFRDCDVEIVDLEILFCNSIQNRPGTAQVGTPLKVNKKSQGCLNMQRHYCENVIKFIALENTQRGSPWYEKRFFLTANIKNWGFSKKNPNFSIVKSAKKHFTSPNVF